MFDEKYRLVKEGKKGVDKKVDKIIAGKNPTLEALYQKSLELRKSPLKKGYIEASLLCESDLTKISKILDVPEDILDFYKEFFFDVEGLDKLSKVEHINGIDDDNEKVLKLWALGQGIEFVSWRLGNKVETSPISGLTELYSMCMYKAKEAVYSGNSSEASKEALKWTKLSADIARLLKAWTMDSDAAKSDLRIAIAEVVPDFVGLDQLLDK